ncbi:MAG: SDR family NAD(P)-dependent oxidoreductase [Bacteroidota bacterium]
MNIIVTGASRGIGYELVKIYSASPENTIIAISRNVQKLNQLKNECQAMYPNSKVIPLGFDLNEKNMEGLMAEVNKYMKTVNILVNNAGAIVNKSFMEITSSDMETVFNVNVFGVVRLIQEILPMMVTKTRGHVINISSVGGYQGSVKFAGLSAYSSSKAALACMTECLAEEFKDMNVAFNCLALGAVQTDMLEEAFPGYRAPLTALEMAEFISKFSVNAHKVMNGKVIPVSLSTP